MMTSQVIRKLYDRGLVDRVADPRDARSRRVQITAHGRQVATASIAAVEAADHAYFATVEDRELLSALIQALNRLAGAGPGVETQYVP